MRTPALALTLAIALPSLVAGDCGDDTKNLLAKLNCGFDQNVSGWSALPDAALPDVVVSHDAGNGDPTPGALAAGGGPQGSATIVGPCLSVTPSTSYAFGARLRVSRGNAYFCAVQLFEFSDEACSTSQEPLAAEGRPPGKEWEPASGSATTGSSSGSVAVRLVCSGEPEFTVLFDELVFARR